ncbi:type IV secretion system protein [Klenkia brasiliensis]|uniref:TrbL/VirB6 plasmid conjugal transfer protein n=1 Tax=Klenkia brasiliensis TaxID=333142 RepID=A0A1G7SCT0_9ACTN|nr:type IV secretion system protein [Klenkia brasiliensis]SDG20249.1 TrbL/VirB6 plasmid conjugal transfer protein [Klenkia brasiliensis]
MGEDVVAIDLNPMTWLGDLAAEAIADVWTAAMVSIWSAGLWLLGLAFRVIDALTTPDVSETGPMGAVLPTTLWLGASVAVVMMFVQLTLALVRRDGRSLGRIVLGVLQFGLVWVGYLGAAGGFILAAAELARGILTAMLDVDSLAAVDPANSWPRDVVDATAATVLGLSSLLLVIPAAFFYVIIALVREAALIILIATAPISAGGLLSDSTRAWFWKSLRWFFASLLITPTAALMLGIGVQLSAGVVAGSGDDTAQAAGTAVVGAVMVAIGAVCPLVLFRLLAFVDPGTASGSALRQSWSDAGGLPGLARGGGQSSGSGAAAATSGDGRSHGEAAAEAQSVGRLGAAATAVGGAAAAGVGVAAAVAHRTVDLAADVLSASGVGHPSYPAGSGQRRSQRSSAASGAGGGQAPGTSLDRGQVRSTSTQGPDVWSATAPASPGQPAASSADEAGEKP